MESLYKIIKFNFFKKTEFLYDYEHKILPTSVMVSENHNIALSGGYDQKLVLHNLTSGQTIKVFNLKNNFKSILRLKSIVILGENGCLSFFDLESKEKIEGVKVKTKMEHIICIRSNISALKKLRHKNVFLFLGGIWFKNIIKIRIPIEIYKRGNNFFNKK